MRDKQLIMFQLQFHNLILEATRISLDAQMYKIITAPPASIYLRYSFWAYLHPPKG